MNFLRNRKKINYKRISVSIIVVIGIFTINIGYSYIETITSLLGSLTTTDNLNNCYDVEILGKRVNACLDNKKSKYVSSATGIDFSKGGSTSNGKGVYIYSSTKSDVNPVYYYRGDVNNNNLIFADRCWKIVRTTDTGGTKLLYNGVPTNGKCNNTGDASQLSTSQFNESPSALSSTGFMYGEKYPLYDKYLNVSGYTTANDNNFYINKFRSTAGSSRYNWYYSTSYTYSNGTFTLGTDAKQYGEWSTAWNELKNGYYTCLSTSKSCSSLKYIYDGTETVLNYVDVTKPVLIENPDDSSSEYKYFDPNDINDLTKYSTTYTSYNYYMSKEYEWDGTNYKLINPVKIGDWRDIYNTAEGYFTCLSSSSYTCKSLDYITSYSYSTYFYSIPLDNGRTIEEENIDIKLADSYTTNEDGTFTLNNPITVKRSNWHNESSNNIVGKYFCKGLAKTTCDDIYILTYKYTNSYEYMKDITVTYANSATWDGTNYTLSSDNVTYSIKQLITAADLLKKYHYTCFNTETSCSQLSFIVSSGKDQSSFDYAILSNGILDPYSEMLPNDNSRNSNDSVIKKYIDDNLFDVDNGLKNYTSYLEDTIWCNDRTIPNIKGWNPNGGNGSSITFKFGSGSSTDLSCTNNVDSFTVDSSIGNGKLKYPVGLLTSSEAILGGITYSSSYVNKSYLFSGSAYWTMTPADTYSSSIYMKGVYNSTGYLYDMYISSYYGVRPSVSLKKGVTISSGSGTGNDPYIVE